MSLITNIYNQTRALGVHLGSIEATGKNIANVNNPEYARQRVQVVDRGSMVIGNQVRSLGIDVGTFDSARDALLDRQVVNQTSLFQQSSTASTLHRQMLGYWGESINRAADSGTLNGIQDASPSSLGLTERFDAFFNSISDLSANPSEAGMKEVVVQEARALTDQLRDVASNLDRFSDEIDQRLSNEMDTANGLLRTVASLNVDIASVEMRSGAGTAVDLRDARQLAVEKLAEIMDISTSPVADSFGQIQITVNDGTGSPVTVLDRGSVIGEFSFDGSDIVFGSGATVMGLSSGRAQALLSFRDTNLADLQSNLDAVAAQLVTSINSVYPTDFFNPAGLTAQTIALDSGITAATLVSTATANAGANDVTQAIFALRNQTFSTGGGDSINGTFKNFLINTTGRIGQAASVADQKLSNQQVIQRMLNNERAAVIGVDLDEEAADLMRFQRAYQATSRVIGVIDDLLEQLVRGF